MSETVSVTLSTTAYTALSSGETDVKVYVPRGKQVRFVVASSLPAAASTAYVDWNGSVVTGLPFVADGIASTDELYAMALNEAFAVQVQRTTSALGTVQIANAPTVSTASLTSLASAATSAQLLAANTSRKGLTLFNTDANGVYVKYGTTASATSFTVLIPTNGYWEMPEPIYTGRIDAIWAADGSGSLYATEL